MRRSVVIGLILLVSIAVIVGVRVKNHRFQLAAARAAHDVKPSEPIPQDAAAIEKRRHDLLAWNHRTLKDAYECVGKKDPRWDKPARETLDLAARMFSGEVDPQVTFTDVHSAAKAAVDAGCVDPMVFYLYARTSIGANDPGPQEARRRARVAAEGLATSQYPAFRRAVALRFSGESALSATNRENPDREQAEHDFASALALLEESVAGDEDNEFWEESWFNTLMEVTRGRRSLGVTAEAAYKRVDGELARVPGAKFLRLLYRGGFWFGYGWEARTESFAPAVPLGGFDQLEKRLAIAREAYEDAWKLQPGSGAAARALVEIDKAVGGDRATMELWFERAMKANGDDRTACWSKLDWLDPKWYGSLEDMLAFGRACRDTKNSRTGITLLVAEAHWRIACMPGENQNTYLALPEVWADIQSVYDEYLKHHPVDDVARSKFATLCYLSAHYREAEVQYVALGDNLTQWGEMPFVPLDQLKENRERNGRIVMNKEGRITFPGWHFVGGTNAEGKWQVNIPVEAPHQKKPGILGANASHVWNCTAEGITYGIRMMRIPPALREDSPGQILEAARSVVARERSAPPRDLRETMLAARRAEEYYVDAPDLKPMQLRVKTIVIGTWLYELSVTASKNDITGRSANEFFDSFAFQAKAKTSADTTEP
jgi:hypothetical protein